MTGNCSTGTPWFGTPAKSAEPARKKITISQVCKQVPGARANEHITPSTVCRWILSGAVARSGERLRLRATRAGSRWLVDPTDLEAFFAALSADPFASDAPATTPRSPAQRRKASDTAAKKLDQILA